MTDFFEVLENNKLASDEFIKRDVTKEINKLFERNMQNVKELGLFYFCIFQVVYQVQALKLIFLFSLQDFCLLS